MKIADLTGGIEIRWIDFSAYRSEILAIRRAVFLEEQQFGDHMLESAKDATGLHIAAFHGGQIISCLSTFLFSSAEAEAQGLPEAQGWVVQFGRRVELAAYRSLRIAPFLAAITYKHIFETLQPSYCFISLIGLHRHLRPYYQRTYQFSFLDTQETANGPIERLILRGYDSMQQLYIRLRQVSGILQQHFQTDIGHLSDFIAKNTVLAALYQPKAEATNNYLKPLSFNDELPRLARQGRLLYMTQAPILHQIDWGIAEGGRLLDAGCGPGLYAALLSKHPALTTFEITGMDISPEMLLYASLTHPKLRWREGSLYEMPFADQSFDVVHTSFVFIHLLQVPLALREIRRVLKPGGRLVVVDVNDATFKGHPVLKRMIDKHDQYAEGNRSILSDLPTLATAAAFEPHQSFEIIVDNTGLEAAPELTDNRLALGKLTMWSMFAVMGQRPEIASIFQKAEQLYLHTEQNISINIQTQVYVKH